MDNKFEIVFIDENIIVVSKSHNICVIPDRYGREKFILQNMLQDIYGKIYVVHRLDKGTGGLIIFARNKNAHKNLCCQFENNTVSKKYLAITEGVFFPQTLMLPIGRGNKGKYKINFKSGKRAVTSFNIIDTKNNYSLVEVALFTGRTHQIRIHLKALKAPLYQDFLYGKSCQSKELTLFSKEISLYHPKTNKSMTFSAEISKFMLEKIEFLGLSFKNMVSNKNDAS